MQIPVPKKFTIIDPSNRMKLMIALSCTSLILFGCGKNFESAEVCRSYVRENSANMDKLRVGSNACGWSFVVTDIPTETSKVKTAKCIISNFSDISDDTSGTRVVTKCAEKNDAASYGRVLAANFSPSARIEKELREHRDALEESQRENQKTTESLMPYVLSSPTGPSIFPMEINGQLKNCIRIGNILDCD